MPFFSVTFFWGEQEAYTKYEIKLVKGGKIWQVSRRVFKIGKVDFEYYLFTDRCDILCRERRNTVILEIGTTFEEKNHDFFLQFFSISHPLCVRTNFCDLQHLDLQRQFFFFQDCFKCYFLIV